MSHLSLSIKCLNRLLILRFFIFIGLLVVLLGLGSCVLERETIRPQKNLSKDDPKYYEFAANYYYNKGELEKAIFQYETLKKKFSAQPRIYEKHLAWADYEIGFCYLVMEDYNQALTYFEKVITDHRPTVSKILANDRINEINKLQGE